MDDLDKRAVAAAREVLASDADSIDPLTIAAAKEVIAMYENTKPATEFDYQLDLLHGEKER
jgi:hypothetical protein